ncbi:MAG: dihydroxyacetone kinase phosphoryl donor subunit DhaM [Microbacteriaceae bacterium]
MIGIVVVSHSPALAAAAVDLATQMVGASPPPIAIAAGAGDGVIGTDATRVAAAIEQVASDDGVLVFMDLGSAVMSAEMALEFVALSCEVRLTDAPFVEGLVAAVVLAAAGAPLDEVDREARAAMDAKRGQLAPDTAPTTGAPAPEPAPALADASADATADVTLDVTLVNVDGLHARPAATLVKTVSAFDAVVTLSDLTSGKGPVSAKSLIAVMSLGAAVGNTLRVQATGAQASEAVDAVRTMVEDAFGEQKVSPKP